MIIVMVMLILLLMVTVTMMMILMITKYSRTVILFGCLPTVSLVNTVLSYLNKTLRDSTTTR